MRNATGLSVVILLLSLFLLTQNSAAQSEEKPLSTNDIHPSLESVNLKLNNFESTQQIVGEFDFKSTQKQFLLARISNYNRFLFKQSLVENNLGVGGYTQYSNGFYYQNGRKYQFNIQTGLVLQNSLINYTEPIYNYFLSSGFEYSLFNGVSVYFNGQYVSSPLNKDNGYLDPFIYMNPMYLQSEISIGVKAEYRNLKADVGMKSMYDTQYKQSNSINSMNTKVSIGF